MKEKALSYLPEDMMEVVRRFYKNKNDMVHKHADIEKAKQMGYTKMRDSGFEQVTLWFKQCFQDGILFKMDIPMLKEGDFGGPYDLFVGINGKICMVDAWEDKIQK